MANQKIKCDVENCKYNDVNDELCQLDEIKVSCDCVGEDAYKEDTICNSFESNSGLNDSK